ncbi:uncharacterized protein LOC108672899 [Hyalella azteca]|uniref:Uncharacterized protein LOC108672899 n=1 Tax=Hyalella azteca TaxID=294128 RepID=A0A8B7NR32_HYAAZ|nr:uncharacterized protein LOC108672899 [Hyalella azteca]
MFSYKIILIVGIAVTLSQFEFGATADLSPFSPPFLRGAGQVQPQSQFNYLQPQAHVPSLIHPHAHYAGNPNLENPALIGPSMLQSEPEEIIPDENIYFQNNNFHHPSDTKSHGNTAELNGQMVNPSMNRQGHFLENSVHDPKTYSSERGENIPESNQFGNEQELDGTKTGRPQLRQLVLDPASVSREAEARREKLRGENPPSRRGRSNPRVSEGHRLITRALWRIFDALMEKNENQALQTRMTFVENALKDMITSDSKLEGMIEMVKEENMGQEERLDALAAALDSVQQLEARVQELETWKLKFERQKDEEEIVLPYQSRPAYRSCPAPFETVGGECFYVAGETKRTWQDARRDCSKYGGDLAAPNSLTSLRTYLQSLAYRPEYVWVGASRQGNGDWVWSAGPTGSRAVSMDEQTWNEDLPNGLGNCMGLYEGAEYRAYDYTCGEEDLYVCQFFL